MIQKNEALLFLFILVMCSSCLKSTQKHIAKSKNSENQAIALNIDSVSNDPESDKLYQERNKHLLEVNKLWYMEDTSSISELGIQVFMNRILPQVNLYAESDVTEIFYNNHMQKRFPLLDAFYSQSYGDSTQISLQVQIDDFENTEALVIGKFIDGKQTFAIAYDIKNSFVQFFRIANGKWKEIGSKQQDKNSTFQRFFFEEVNGKPGSEIVMATHPNMNGNMWMELFCYSEITDKISFAGDFCTAYEIDLKNKTLREEYEGSWYMDNHKTLYVWVNNYLVPLRQSILVVPKDQDSSNYFLEYYENNLLIDSSRKDLRLIFKEPYNEKNKKHQKYWDDFFLIENTKE